MVSGAMTRSCRTTATTSQRASTTRSPDVELGHQAEGSEREEQAAGHCQSDPVGAHQVTSTRVSHLVFRTPARLGAIRRSG